MLNCRPQHCRFFPLFETYNCERLCWARDDKIITLVYHKASRFISTRHIISNLDSDVFLFTSWGWNYGKDFDVAGFKDFMKGFFELRRLLLVHSNETQDCRLNRRASLERREIILFIVFYQCFSTYVLRSCQVYGERFKTWKVFRDLNIL